jgi:hypothetical protein
LNDSGIARLLEFVHGVKNDPTLAAPLEILTHPSTSTDLGEVCVEIEHQTFGSRFAAAKYLYETLDGSGLTQIEQDRGLWAWLALFFYEELCPPSNKGQRKPGEDARWELQMAPRRYYRHLLAGPYSIYKAHNQCPNSVEILLCGPLDEPGEIVGQLAATQEIVRNRPLLAAATSLYLDPETRRPKKGAASKPTPRRAGTSRRFVQLFNQLNVVWDLHAMQPDSILEMLPQEFDRFKH